MNKHTPGPWVATAVSEYEWSIHNANGHPAPHALVIAPNGDLLRRMRSRANARLIAAAPEMLEALEIAFLALGREGGNAVGTSVPGVRDAWLKARAAIARAEGK